MPKVSKANRRASDEEIVRLNSVGLSLSTIGQMLGYHQTNVKLRLLKLGVPPADTRRSFMEDIYNSLPEPQKRWLEDQLSANYSIKDYIKGLLITSYVKEQSNELPSNPERDPALLSEGGA